MELKPGYKQTEVGVIPEDWEVKRLGEVASFLKGKGLPKSDISDSGKHPCIHYGELFTVYGETIGDVRSRTDCIDGMFRSAANDVLMPTSDVTPRGLAKASCIGIDGVILGGDILVIRLASKLVYGSYLSLVIRYEESQVLQLVTGTTVYHLYGSDMKQFTFPLPPLPEQKAIAKALSDMDSLLGGLDSLIAKKRDVKQATMQQLLTGKTRLPGFSGDWEEIGMLQALTQSVTYGIVTAGAFVTSGVRMLRGGDIVDGQIRTESPMVSFDKSAEYARTTLVLNDVVISLVGYPGSAAKVIDYFVGANISRAVGLLRPNKRVSSDYLVSFLNSPIGRRMVLAPSAGSAQQVVNLSELNKLRFWVPPLPEQQAIAKVLTDMDAELEALEQRRDKTRELKQAMMQELLTGRTRLV